MSLHDVVGPILTWILASSRPTGATVPHDTDVSAEPSGGRLDLVPRTTGSDQARVSFRLDDFRRGAVRSQGVVERENSVARTR